MGKQTKRARKFATKGGVKARLEKGTVTQKGKLQRKRKNNGGPPLSDEERAAKRKLMADAREEKQQQQQGKGEDDGDFLSQANLGDLDMETFLSSAVDKMESQLEGDGSDEDEEEEIDDDEDDDDDEKLEEEEADDDEVADVKQKKDVADSDDDDDDDDDDGSDSDDDVDAAEERMKKEMEKLKSSDPEFHSFLKKNERSLLEFGDEDEIEQDDDDDEDEDADDDDDDDEDKDDERDATGNIQEKKKEASSPDTHVHLTAKVLKSLELGAFRDHGIKSLKRLMNAYKSACHLSDSSSNDDLDDSDKRKGKKYLIDSSEIFDKLMVMCMNRCHEEFRYHLIEQEEGADKSKDNEDKPTNEDEEEDEDDDDNKPLNPKKLEKAAKFEDIKGVVQSFFRSTCYVLTQGKEAQLLTFVLKALSKYIRYLTPFPRSAQACLKVLVSLWSAPLDQSEDYQVVRLNAFLRIRQMALTQPFPFIEDCLKKTYLAYAQRAKFGTASSVSTVLPTLTIMGNCVVELYSLDYYSSYQHAFVYIRQLALLLRTALQKKTPESFQAVYCWQFIHSLKLWVAFLASTCQQNLRQDFSGREEEVKHLRSLIYPLVEVIFGTIRLVPMTRYLPLRFHCVRLLQQLAAAAELYIPTSSVLLDVLDLKEIYMKPKRTTTRNVASKGMQLALSLKLAKDSPLRTFEELEACINELFVLLNREVDLYRYSAGFPEFTVRICQQLRKFSKKTLNSRWRAYAKGCIDLCQRHSEWVIQKRSTLQEAPKDVKRLEVLKPNNEPSMGERYKDATSKENRFESSSRPVLATAKLGGRAAEAAAADKSNDEDEEEQGKRETSQSKKKRKKSSKKETPASALSYKAQQDPGALEQADEVAEGVNWSDDE